VIAGKIPRAGAEIRTESDLFRIISSAIQDAVDDVRNTSAWGGEEQQLTN
jgi:hypothetical protein